MTPAREAIYLPVLFLTVTLLGGLRPGSAVVLAPPSLFSLVLAVLLAGVLVQSGAFVPLRVMNASRPALANLNGGVLVAALLVASAQIFSLLTPDAGLPRVLFSVYFLVLLLNTMAASPDRVRVLRSLAVTFGAAFVLKFIVLDAFSDPAGGRLARVLQVLFEGVTLGTLTQEAQHPAAGYIAFASIAMFLAALSLLPSTDRGSRRPDHRDGLNASGGLERSKRSRIIQSVMGPAPWC
jgi:hypothetical protein